MNLSEAFEPSELSAALSQWGRGAHHPLGPSSLHRVQACPASALGNLVCAEHDTATEAAERGTRIHKAIETWITHGLEPDGDSDEAEHLERAKLALGRAPRLWSAELPVDFLGLYFGTADAVLVNVEKRLAYILDWKTGRAAEMAEDSHRVQLRHLALALLSMPEYSGIVRAVARAVYTETGTEGETVEVSAEELPDHASRMAELTAVCRSGEAPFAADIGDHCKYCRVLEAGRCPTFASKALAAAAKLDVAIPEPTGSALMTVAEADGALLKCNLVYKALEAIEARAKEAIREAGGSENFAVVSCAGSRRTDWKAVAMDAAIPQELIDRHTSLSKPTTQIRERIRK